VLNLMRQAIVGLRWALPRSNHTSIDDDAGGLRASSANPGSTSRSAGIKVIRGKLLAAAAVPGLSALESSIGPQIGIKRGPKLRQDLARLVSATFDIITQQRCDGPYVGVHGFASRGAATSEVHCNTAGVRISARADGHRHSPVRPNARRQERMTCSIAAELQQSQLPQRGGRYRRGYGSSIRGTR
jgi:hypothetical protein